MAKSERWALILGGSSGLGLASAKKLSAHGFNILIVHRDRKSDLQQINKEFQEITSNGVELKSFNADASNSVKRTEILNEIKAFLPNEYKIRVLVHSIAKGSMQPMNPYEGRALNHQDFEITLNAMAISLYDWTKELDALHLLDDDTRIISFTSEGNTRAWPGAAKVTLEAITRNIALEFAAKGIKANCLQAGITETQSFSMIPGSEELKKSALERNPNKRLTTPEDVANAVYLLTLDEAKWITGTVIKVDGGESLR